MQLPEPFVNFAWEPKGLKKINYLFKIPFQIKVANSVCWLAPALELHH
jgi:hypothetical protein